MDYSFDQTSAMDLNFDAYEPEAVDNPAELSVAITDMAQSPVHQPVRAPASPSQDIVMEAQKFAPTPRKTRKVARDEANGVKRDTGYGPIKKVREKNKNKHNESEARRRGRLRDKFFELKEAAHVQRKDRFNILTQAISRLQEYEDRIAELEEEKAQLLIKPTVGAAPTGANVVTSAPSSPTLESGSDTAPAQKKDELVHSPGLANIPVATVALDGRLTDCNTAFSQLTGYQSDQLDKVSLFSLTHPLEMMETFATVKKLLTGDLRASESVRTVVDSKGANVTVHQTLTTIALNGKPSHYLLMLLPKPASSSTASQMQFANAVVVGTTAAVELGYGLGLQAQAEAPFRSVSAADQVLGLDSGPLSLGLAF